MVGERVSQRAHPARFAAGGLASELEVVAAE
jgi:hypothetical protein